MKKLMLGCAVLRSICAVGMMALAATAEAAWSKGGTGTETNPWNIGNSSPYTNVQAWTNGAGRLTITGAGEMMSFATGRPWPNTIKEVVVGDGVTSIGANAFESCGSLTTVEMPSVTSIGDGAFYKCASLESVEMPSVTSIGGNAFHDCGSLNTVLMPLVTTIGSSAFNACQKLTSITILTKNPPTCGGSAFFQVPTTCMMFISPEADVAVWQSTLSSAGYKGGFQSVPVVADGKGCLTSAEVNTAIADGCKKVVFCEDCNWGLVVPVGKKTTFDLYGKTLSGALTVNGDLTVKDSAGGGSVVQSEYPVVATTGSLKFEDAAITIKGCFSMPSAEQKPEPSGAVSGAEFESVQIVDGKAYLDVSVWTSDTITNQNWSVATNGVIEVPAEGKTGFFILQSKAAVPSDNNPANKIIEDR